MRLLACLLFTLVAVCGACRAEDGKEEKKPTADAKTGDAPQDPNAPAGPKTYSGPLYTKADTAPEKVLAVLSIKTGLSGRYEHGTILLVADGEVGKAIVELLDKHVNVTVTGRTEGEFFRVDSVKVITEEADDGKKSKKRGQAKTEDDAGKDAKDKGEKPPKRPHNPNNNNKPPKPPSDPVQVAP